MFDDNFECFERSFEMRSRVGNEATMLAGLVLDGIAGPIDPDFMVLCTFEMSRVNMSATLRGGRKMQAGTHTLVSSIPRALN